MSCNYFGIKWLTKGTNWLHFTFNLGNQCFFQLETKAADAYLLPISVLFHGESVVHSESTHPCKPSLSTIERGHHVGGWPFRAELWKPTVGDFYRIQNSAHNTYPTKVLRTRLWLEVPSCVYAGKKTEYSDTHKINKQIKNIFKACIVSWVARLCHSCISLRNEPGFCTEEIQMGEKKKFDLWCPELFRFV